MVRISPFFKSSLALGSSTVGRLLMGVVKSKTAAVVLGAEGVGLLGLLSQIELLGSAFVSLTMSNGIARRVSQDRSKSDQRDRTLGVETSIWMVSVLCAVFVLVGSLGVIYAATALPSWENRWHLLLPILVAVPLHSIIASVVAGVYFGLERIKEYSAGSLVGGAVELALYLMLVKPFGVEGALWASTFGFLAWLVFALWKLRAEEGALPRGSFRFDSAIAKELVLAGLAMTIVGVFSYASSVLIRAYLLDRLSPAEAGIYHVGIVFSSLYTPLLTNGIWARLHPKASADFGSAETRHDWSESLVFAALFGSAIQAGLICFSGLAIVVLYSRAFLPATDLIPVQMLGDFFHVLAQPTMAILLARARLKLYLAAWLGYYCVLCSVTLLLVPSQGLLAAPYAHLASSTALFVVSFSYFLRHAGAARRRLKVGVVLFCCLAFVLFTMLGIGSEAAWPVRVAVLTAWCAGVTAVYLKLRDRLVE